MKEYQQYTDYDIITGIKNFNNLAYKAIYYNRTETFRKYILKNGGSSQDADEVEQKTIIVLFEKIRDDKFKLNEGTRLSTYLFAIARNLWLKDLAKRGKNVNIDKTQIGDEYIDDINDHDVKFRQEDLLRSEIKLLNEGCRAILIGWYYFKKSYDQMAVEIGTTTADNIRKNKAKCMKKLKTRILNKIKSYE